MSPRLSDRQHRQPEHARLPVLCREAVDSHRMIEPGGRVIVGLSGGADSVALLYALLELSKTRGFSLAAAHLNHRLRGEESDRDEDFVRKLCRELGVPLTVESVQLGAGRSVEERAREWRYDFFARCAADLPGAVVATAHTLDDSAETLLFHLARGTGLRGLCGIPPVHTRGGLRVVRPLITCTRQEVEAYCAQKGLGYVTDSSNQSDDYTRNRLRHRVIPELRAVRADFPRGLAGTLDDLRADADYLDAQAAGALHDATRALHCYNAAALLALPRPLRRRALLRILADHDLPPDRRRVLRLEQLLERGGALRLSAQWDCRRRKGELRFFRPVDPATEHFAPILLPYPFRSEEIPVFSDKTLRVSCLLAGNYEENMNNHPNRFKNALDCDKIGANVVLRRRLPGDRYRPAGRGCTKTLKKLLSEAGLTPGARARVLVLADTRGPIWVEGFGPDESVCVDKNTRRLLFLEVWEDTACTPI